jgi:catechol 2,3-dioxygenase-like lactoylglutathione lyase family enzyme
VNLALDHVVIAARTLDEGVAWCEATLGVTPGPGGQHAFMGTHNRLLRIDTPRFPRSYLEIIAIDAAAPAPARPRWFGLDDAAACAALQTGPQLWHWVARTPDVDAAVATLRELGADGGEVVQAQRDTPRGLLRWRITVRADGRLLYGGAWPTLIEWPDVHPVDAMPASNVQLHGVTLQGLPPILASHLPDGVESGRARAGQRVPLQIDLATPGGIVRLRSPA